MTRRFRRVESHPGNKLCRRVTQIRDAIRKNGRQTGAVCRLGRGGFWRKFLAVGVSWGAGWREDCGKNRTGMEPRVMGSSAKFWRNRLLDEADSLRLVGPLEKKLVGDGADAGWDSGNFWRFWKRRRGENGLGTRSIGGWDALGLGKNCERSEPGLEGNRERSEQKLSPVGNENVCGTSGMRCGSWSISLRF